MFNGATPRHSSPSLGSRNVKGARPGGFQGASTLLFFLFRLFSIYFFCLFFFLCSAQQSAALVELIGQVEMVNI